MQKYGGRVAPNQDRQSPEMESCVVLSKPEHIGDIFDFFSK